MVELITMVDVELMVVAAGGSFRSSTAGGSSKSPYGGAVHEAHGILLAYARGLAVSHSAQLGDSSQKAGPESPAAHACHYGAVAVLEPGEVHT